MGSMCFDLSSGSRGLVSRAKREARWGVWFCIWKSGSLFCNRSLIVTNFVKKSGQSSDSKVMNLGEIGHAGRRQIASRTKIGFYSCESISIFYLKPPSLDRQGSGSWGFQDCTIIAQNLALLWQNPRWKQKTKWSMKTFLDTHNIFPKWFGTSQGKHIVCRAKGLTLRESLFPFYSIQK